MGSSSDRSKIDEVLAEFFDAFRSGPDVGQRLAGLRELMLPRAVIVRTCGMEPLAMTVEEFIAPRLALLTDGTLEDFREWQVEGRTEVLGDLATHLCTYAKEGRQRGVAFTGRGVKAVHLVRTPVGWRISAVIWDDERDGFAVPELPSSRTSGPVPAGATEQPRSATWSPTGP